MKKCSSVRFILKKSLLKDIPIVFARKCHLIGLKGVNVYPKKLTSNHRLSLVSLGSVF